MYAEITDNYKFFHLKRFPSNSSSEDAVPLGYTILGPSGSEDRFRLIIKKFQPETLENVYLFSLFQVKIFWYKELGALKID